jgi:hypothetical protein
LQDVGHFRISFFGFRPSHFWIFDLFLTYLFLFVLQSEMDYTIIHPGGLVDTPGGREEFVLDVDDQNFRLIASHNLRRWKMAFHPHRQRRHFPNFWIDRKLPTMLCRFLCIYTN